MEIHEVPGGIEMADAPEETLISSMALSMIRHPRTPYLSEHLTFDETTRRLEIRALNGTWVYEVAAEVDDLGHHAATQISASDPVSEEKPAT